ncbi:MULTISPECIES: hypothetical protein [Bacillus subtilis group]|mgnify:CR=1 FL=1|uniref:hypothetical protein n=1 Tax=Bacillus subtilis group TaxID=653685 RepID=UPI00100A119E|nr:MULTISPECIES: hypothetical protein [Bacillus subtilis group]MCY7883117.1 hypothetical protein [Bacillus spizizenii]MCY8056460.1 hypothetical protein [Bacillus inaquosorum]MCY8635269.1 hypothetical protein [Bacillus spizizenii]MCY9397613.1 hypothetical protein [Bacillus inaquosorum]MEC0400825.1 hypothetical protein [Bacillus subtilis]
MLGYQKKVMTIDEMNAYRKAYGDPLAKKEIFTALVVPFVLGFSVVMALFYYWWLAILGGILASTYGYVVLMRNSVQRFYTQHARIQRNRFINNMTELLVNPEETVITALKWCAHKDISDGEFKKDLDTLIARLMKANEAGKKQAFEEMRDKYSNDFVFGLFIDMLITAITHGRNDIEKIKELAAWHNEVMEETSILMESKERAKQHYKITSIYNISVIAILTFAMGFNGFLLYYAHNPIGWASSLLLLGLAAYHFNTFQNRMLDDEVTQMKGWRKSKKK